MKKDMLVDSSQVEDRSGDLVFVQEERKGIIENGQGFVLPTYNAYAWWGYEVQCDEESFVCTTTGRIVCEVGNNASSQTDYFSERDWESIGGFDGVLSEFVQNGWSELEEEGVV